MTGLGTEMKTALFLFLAWVGVAGAAPIEEAYLQRIVANIYHIEGGAKAKVPYGILSIKTRSKEHARTLCSNTVKRTWDRWESAARPGDFLEFLGKRYCPVAGDTTGLNKNWVRNLRLRMGRPRDFSVK